MRGHMCARAHARARRCARCSGRVVQRSQSQCPRGPSNRQVAPPAALVCSQAGNVWLRVLDGPSLIYRDTCLTRVTECTRGHTWACAHASTLPSTDARSRSWVLLWQMKSWYVKPCRWRGPSGPGKRRDARRPEARVPCINRPKPAMCVTGDRPRACLQCNRLGLKNTEREEGPVVSTQARRRARGSTHSHSHR